MTAPTLAQQRAQFVAEFAQIEDALAHACAELGKLLATYRLNPAGLMDAQAHALASARALRTVAEAIPAAGKPVAATRPQAWTATLADQLTSHRVAVAQTLALVALMPAVDSGRLTSLCEDVAGQLATAERIARTHQPGKARQ